MLNNAKQLRIGHSFEILPTVDSSNNYAMQQIHDGTAVHGNVYMALQQTSGKGQRNKVWHTGINNNLALSIVVQPRHLALQQQFLLTCFVSVTLATYLQQYNSNICIKWPNDIYINNRKLAGILIENTIRGTTWNYAVIGMGVNVNEEKFSEALPNAIALNAVANTSIDIYEMAKNIVALMEQNWQTFVANPTYYLEQYNTMLYKKNEPVKLVYNGATINTTVNSVTPNGVLHCGTAKEYAFNHGEVEWVL